MVVVSCFVSIGSIIAQDVIEAGIYDIILAAQSESPDYLIAKTERQNSEWVYTEAKSIFKPQLGFSATLPSLNRSFSEIPLPDGTRAFRSTAFMRNTVGLNLQQVVGATGGTVFVSSQLQRLDQFRTGNIDAAQSFLAVPINIGFTQPIMRFNRFKWDKKAAKLRYETSQKVYVENREKIAFDAMNNFFDLYTTMLSLNEAKQNKKYLDSIAVNAKGRFEVGRISETDLLQIQLGAKNADGTVARLALGVQNKTEALRDFLGISNEVEFKLVKPKPITIYKIDKDKALEYAKKYRSQTEQFRISLLQAERDVEFAEKENGPNLSLNGQFGLTQSSSDFGGAFRNLLDQEGVSLSVDIPIADFGRSKAQREIAKSNLELTKLRVKQSEVTFEREILVNVEQFELKRNQLQLSEEALDIAAKRLDIAKKRFKIGKIDVTNLNIAIQEEQGARQTYFNTLWDLWRAHYTLRNLTLFDFENGIPLE